MRSNCGSGRRRRRTDECPREVNSRRRWVPNGTTISYPDDLQTSYQIVPGVGRGETFGASAYWIPQSSTVWLFRRATPWEAETFRAGTADEVVASSQSVSDPSPQAASRARPGRRLPTSATTRRDSVPDRLVILNHLDPTMPYTPVRSTERGPHCRRHERAQAGARRRSASSSSTKERDFGTSFASARSPATTSCGRSKTNRDLATRR